MTIHITVGILSLINLPYRDGKFFKFMFAGQFMFTRQISERVQQDKNTTEHYTAEHGRRIADNKTMTQSDANRLIIIFYFTYITNHSSYMQ